MKNMDNRQLYDAQQKKLKNQDDQIDEMIGYTVQGKNLGKEIKNDLEKQNKLLDEVDTNVSI